MHTNLPALRIIPRALVFGFACAIAGLAPAATLTVTKTADTNDNICDADCSLREAIGAAAPDDEIQFAAALFATEQTITLSEAAGFQQLRILKHLTITGPGAQLLTVRRAANATARFRIFDIEGPWFVNLTGMTISGGNVLDTAGSESIGGGVRNYDGQVTLNNCHITNNTAHFGGGIHNRNFGHVSVLNSAVTNNLATAGGPGGGGIENSATLVVTNSTISGNSRTGGGIHYGGGIWSSGQATITNSTIADNRTEGGVNVIAGLYIFNGTVVIRNTIVSGSRNYGTGSFDVAAAPNAVNSSGYNFIGNASGAGGFNQSGDQTGNNAAPIDPRLDPLALRGGTTPIHHLRADSLALDKGKSFGSTTDQRGAPRPVDNPLITNASGGDGADIGAYEIPTFRVVTKTADTNDGTCDADCSLREAIAAAAPGDEIIFATPLFGSSQTITLSAANGFRDLVIAKSLTLSGPGANLLTLQVAPPDTFRVFNINGSGAQVWLSGVTVRGGNAVGNNGGGINANGGVALTLASCQVSGNFASRGAGLYVTSDSSLTLLQSTVSGNTDGGPSPSAAGVHSEGALVVTNSTISGNSNNSGFNSAGGIWTSGTATITHSTITGNTAAGGGTPAGGILSSGGGTVMVRNSIVAANGTSSAVPDVAGTIASSGFNLVGNRGAVAGFTQSSDQTGTAASPLNPRLAPLADNGGGTATHRLEANSPALDRGYSFETTTDQRGRTRPIDQSSAANAIGGDGADIGAYEAPAFLTVTKTADTNDGVCDADCSLREAINTATPGDEIIFASPLFDAPQTITLASANGNLVINKSMSVTGKGAHLLTIQKTAGIFRLFNINGNGVQVRLSHLSLTGGNGAGANGGAINANSGVALTLSHCRVSGNNALRGGGLYVTSDSSLTLLNSTVSGNTTSGTAGTGSSAGGIHNEGILNVTNSTISGNVENTGGNNHGGGLWTNGPTTINSSTITDNQAGGMDSASGIFRAGGTVTIRNSIIAANRSNTTIPDVVGAFTSSGFNLIGNVGLATGFTANADQTGHSASPLDPRLDVLGDYGGTLPTHRLQVSSPALDRGDSSGLTSDQIENRRPMDLPPANASGGDGADIGALERQSLASPTVVSAVSRKVHGIAGTLDIALPLTGPAGVECRQGGAGSSHQVVLTFAATVTVKGASIMSIDGMAGATRSVNGPIVTLDLTAVANAQTLGITLTGVNDGSSTSDVFIPMGVLLGDSNNSGSVSASDIGQVKSASGQSLTASNFRADVTGNGTITASDIGLVKSKSGTQLP